MTLKENLLSLIFYSTKGNEPAKGQLGTPMVKNILFRAFYIHELDHESLFHDLIFLSVSLLFSSVHTLIYSATMKSVNAENMCGMFIVLQPIRFNNQQTKSRLGRVMKRYLIFRFMTFSSKTRLIFFIQAFVCYLFDLFLVRNCEDKQTESVFVNSRADIADN